MNETTALVPVFTSTLNSQTIELCNARDLHAALQVGRDFSNWIKGRIEEYGFAEGEDYYSPDLANIRRGRGKPRTDYHLTLDMAKELAMIENNEIGRAVRRYFIAREKTARQNPAIPHLITTDQAGEIRTLIDERFPDGRHRPYAWSRFNNHFRISGYKNLHASRFEEACAYIPTMPRPGEGIEDQSFTVRHFHALLEKNGYFIGKKEEWVRRADLLQFIAA